MSNRPRTLIHKLLNQLPNTRNLISCITLVCSLLIPFGLHAETTKPIPVVAISQLVAHPSLDESRQGIIDALKEAGYEDGKTVKIIYENANGNLPISMQIAQKLAGLSPNVIVAISTPSAQSVVAATRDSKIPVVFASVTDPIGAKLVTNLTKPGGRITGATDAVSVEKQVKLLKTLLPQVKTIGAVYNASEANSVSTVKQLKEVAAKHALTVMEATAANSNEVIPALESLVGKVDVLFLPTDNTVISATDAVLGMAKNYRLPTFASEIQTVDAGALAGVGFKHYDVGLLAGKKIIAILQGTPAGDLPVESPANVDFVINLKTAKSIGVNVPETALKEAQFVVE